MQAIGSFILLLLLPFFLVGQSESFTSDNYRSVLKEAESNTAKQIRKTVEILKRYKQGKITGTTTNTTQYLPPDRWRSSSVEEEGGIVVERIDTIGIGNVVYTRKNYGKWMRREKLSGDLGGNWKDNSQRDFSRTTATVNGEKFQVLIEEAQVFLDGFAQNDRFTTWIDGGGLIRKKTWTRETLKDTPEPSREVSESETTYDYKLDPPKIEAPKN